MPDTKTLVNRYIQRLEEDNSYRSDLHMDCNFDKLVALGIDAIPHLLSLLGTSWYVILALSDITGVADQIITNDMAGRFKEINEAWRQWGIKEGLI